MATRNQVYFLEDDDLWEEQSLLFAPPSPIRGNEPPYRANNGSRNRDH